MIPGDGWGLSFPDICHTVKEKPQKKPQPGKLTWLEIEPGPARWEETKLPLNHTMSPIFMKLFTGILQTKNYT